MQHPFLRVGHRLQGVDLLFGDDDEQRRVHGVRPFAQDRTLPTALAAQPVGRGPQELASVLEVTARHDPPERLARRQRFAVASIHIAELALRHRNERRLVYDVLPPPVAEVDAAAQQFRLEAGLVRQRDDTAGIDRAAERPQLFDDAELVVRDVSQREPTEQQQTDDDPEEDRDRGSPPTLQSFEQRRTDRRKETVGRRKRKERHGAP